MTGEFQNTAECLEDIAGSSWKSFMAYQLGGCEVPGREMLEVEMARFPVG